MSLLRSVWPLGLLAAVATASGCGGLRYSLTGTGRAVGADAELTAQVNPDQSMTRFDLRAYHLAPPGRIMDGADTFVVWERRDNSRPFTRVGSLKYDPNSREGEMKEASVPESAFQLIVSAEVGPFPASPSGYVVFQQIVER